MQVINFWDYERATGFYKLLVIMHTLGHNAHHTKYENLFLGLRNAGESFGRILETCKILADMNVFYTIPRDQS